MPCGRHSHGICASASPRCGAAELRPSLRAALRGGELEQDGGISLARRLADLEPFRSDSARGRDPLARRFGTPAREIP